MDFLRHSLPWPLHSGCGCDAPVDVNPLWAAGRLFPSWMDWPVVCGTPEVGGQAETFCLGARMGLKTERKQCPVQVSLENDRPSMDWALLKNLSCPVEQ